ncbi:hypothetical protein [Bradyrhizobium macuxiense]|nr:hypothetical protein [Bradyrhizobium macuxiense]
MTERNKSWVLHTLAAEITNSDYRRFCHASASLDQRVSLIETKSNCTLRVNIYGCKGDAFADDEVRRIAIRMRIVQ